MGGFRFCVLCKWRNEFEPRRMFHKFPMDPKERKLWLKLTGKPSVKKFASICSYHFKKSCYVSKANGQLYLKAGSVPTLHLKEQPMNTDASNIEVKTNATRKFNCDDCSRKFPTGNALRSHLQHVHKKTIMAKQQAATNIVKPQNIAKKSTTKMPDTESQGIKDSKYNKHSFECPVCQKQFPIYFTAFQHIQKVHCVNHKGQRVSPLSLEIVKPIRIEECICSQTIRSDKRHVCSMKTEIDNKYFCLGCEQIFDNLSLYRVHLRGLHAEAVESFFFPNRSEFTSWKSLLEKHTQTNYVKLSNTSVYHCSHQPLLTSSTLTQLCPSTITMKQISNGYQVTYYKTHVGHECEEYTTPEAVKKNCITSFFKETEDIDVGTEDDEKDLYLQFKRIMNSIVLDAAKINITTLQILLGKAFEITTLLNSYDEDGDNDDATSKKLTDEQISRVLDENIALKRKGEPLQQDTKKVKCIDNGDVKIEKSVTPVRMLRSPPSFNDSYKSFVDQNFKSPDTKEKRKKEIVKTKIGQFKPMSPKAETPKTVTPKSDTPKIVTSRSDNPKILTPKSETPKILTPKSETYETFMPKISKVWTVKPDVKYEVKERDNDCNILILKI